jgi:hypothetical protein
MTKRRPGGPTASWEPCGFRGPTAGLGLQRELFRRWTREPGVHPHEAVTGLLALLHGASRPIARRPD